MNHPVEGFSDQQLQLARLLYKSGAVQADAKNGFITRANRVGESDLLSPLYVNLRDEEHRRKPGPLSMQGFDLIGSMLYDTLMRLGVAYDVIAPVPDAGHAIARALQRRLTLAGKNTPLVHFEKKGEDIVLDEAVIGRLGSKARVLVLDDVISAGGSKLPVIRSLREVGVLVNDCAVCLDREEGGISLLKHHDVGLTALLSLTKLAEIGRQHYPEIVTEEAYAAHLRYLEGVTQERQVLHLR
ncbi:MAG: uridine monophosphate synthetase [Patescibacteria group bacterium]|nr:uridine monophosphate synthetase [Patescibacteria group bacterium]